MEIYICHDKNEKDYFLKNGLKHQAFGTNPRTKEKYWVYTKSDLFKKLKKENDKDGVFI